MPEIALVIALAIVWIIVKDRQISEERDAWAVERRELLTRIQHPEVVPTTQTEREIEISEPDEISLVGEIVE
jgi:hypothetical protein